MRNFGKQPPTVFARFFFRECATRKVCKIHIWYTSRIFFRVLYYHMDTKFGKFRDVFCLIHVSCLNQFLNGVIEGLSKENQLHKVFIFNYRYCLPWWLSITELRITICPCYSQGQFCHCCAKWKIPNFGTGYVPGTVYTLGQ